MNQPIGIFDSGVGGLTVYKEVRALLPKEDIIYVGDTKRAPYGGRPAKELKTFSEEIVTFLLTKKVKLIIIACNTVSSNAGHHLAATFNLPFVELIHLGVKEALAHTQKALGVIATAATVNSGVFQKEAAKVQPNMEVVSRSCPLFVPLVEEGLIREDIVLPVANMYLKDMLPSIDTLVFGCTHYPLLKTAIQKAAPKVKLIDPAVEAASYAKKLLIKNNLENIGIGKDYFYTTGEPEKFEKLFKLFIGREITVENIKL